MRQLTLGLDRLLLLSLGAMVTLLHDSTTRRSILRDASGSPKM